jgi:hypothetical protein
MKVEKVDVSHPMFTGMRTEFQGRTVVLTRDLSPKTRRGLHRVDIEGLHSDTLAKRKPGQRKIRRSGRSTA